MWENDINTRKHNLQESQEVQAGDRKAARNRQDVLHAQNMNNKNDHSSSLIFVRKFRTVLKVGW